MVCIRVCTFGLVQEVTTPQSRATALATLKGCATRPITLGCSEGTAEYLIKLYENGDKALLKPLLEAGLTSDGALSQVLGDFYSNVLWKNPRAFLQALRSYSRTTDQQTLSRLAATTDGSGMSGNMLRDVRRNLHRIRSEHGPLGPIAKICLSEVDKANRKD
jgi:hypothetical protein